MTTLQELGTAVASAIERAADYGEDPANIVVSLQIEGRETIWTTGDVELHYDGNGNASGCVLVGYAQES